MLSTYVTAIVSLLCSCLFILDELLFVTGGGGVLLSLRGGDSKDTG